MKRTTPPTPTGRDLDRRGFLGIIAGSTVLVACGRAGESGNAKPAPAAAQPSAGPAAEQVAEHVAEHVAAPAAGTHVNVEPTPNVLAKRGTAYGPGRYATTEGGTNYVLSRVDLDATPLHAQPMKMPFFGHGLAFDPLDGGRALVFEKHGPGCCEVDLRGGKVKRLVTTKAERQFYGHGVFSADGSKLYCTETETANGTMRGVIAVRDGRTLQWLSDLPSGGAAPHDCVLSGDGRSLVVTNGGGSIQSGNAPCVTWISLATGAIERTLPFSDPTINAGHLQMTPSGDVVVVSAPRDGLDLQQAGVHGDISFWRGESRDGDALLAAGGPIVAKMRAETLSLALVDANQSAVATNPGGNLLTAWSVPNGTLLREITTYGGPRGVALALDGSCLVLTHGKMTELVLLDPTTLAPILDGTLDRSWMSGSHVVVHNIG